MFSRRFWKYLASLVWTSLICFLVVFGVMKLCIDFVTFWDTPRFAYWTYRERLAFLMMWVVLTVSLVALVMAFKDKR